MPDRMQARLEARPGVLDRRREAAEHPLGTIKQWMNQGAFLIRGLEKVRAEFSLTALAYNPRRALNIVGLADLMAALAARGAFVEAALAVLVARSITAVIRCRLSSSRAQWFMGASSSVPNGGSLWGHDAGAFSHGLGDFCARTGDSTAP